tara:strand:+ start:1081 stop:1311 length:231 start_codon:yes stop_codon:yes gene_type:complete
MVLCGVRIMVKYRIKKHKNFYSTSFEVQKKVWFIPFWYNFNNIDGMTTGFYDTEIKAKEAIEYNKFKSKSELISVD